MIHEITIPGAPIPKKRARTLKTGHSYDPQSNEKGAVKLLLKSICRIPLDKELPVRLKIFYGLPIPKSYTKKHKLLALNGKLLPTKKPDIDNLDKFILDCMNGIVFHDDAQVISLKSEKYYSDEPKTVIKIDLFGM